MSISHKNILATLLTLLATTPLYSADIDLRPAAKTGTVFEVRSDLKVSGKLKFRGKEAIERQDLQVTGQLEYLERTDSVPQNERVFAAQVEKTLPLRTTRLYKKADVTIAVGDSRSKPLLQKHHRTVVTELTSKGLQVFSPTDPLSRPELDLIDVQLPSSALNELLPKKPVKLGETWQPVENVWAILLRIDAINKSSVVAKIKQTTADQVEIELKGAVAGAAQGVSTDIDLEGTAIFDRRLRQVSRVSLRIKEDRAIGHAGPGLEVEAAIQVSMTPVAKNADSIQATDWSKLANTARLLRFDTRSGVRVLHDQRWHVMVNGPKLAVLRMIERGDLIAQCNISPLANLAQNKEISLEKLQENITANLDQAFGQFVEASEKTEGHLRILRVVAAGRVSELPIQWVYFVVSQPDGRRVSIVFTMESKLVERFCAADQLMVSALQFLDRQLPATAAKPGGSAKK